LSFADRPVMARLFDLYREAFAGEIKEICVLLHDGSAHALSPKTAGGVYRAVAEYLCDEFFETETKKPSRPLRKRRTA
jgi:hypothetical protein